MSFTYMNSGRIIRRVENKIKITTKTSKGKIEFLISNFKFLIKPKYFEL